MCPKQRMDEDQLEKLLRQMPKVKDERDPSKIYREVQVGLDKRQRQWKLMPAFALAAAVLIFAIITPLFFQNMSSQNSSMDESAINGTRSGYMESSNADTASNDAVDADENQTFTKEFNPTEDGESNELLPMNVMNQSFVVENGLEEANYVVTIGVSALSENAMSDIGAFTFPISLVVSKNEEDTHFSALERIRYELDYEELGLEEPFLNDGAILSMGTYAGGTPMTIIEVGDLYVSYSSLKQFTLEDQIKETLRWTPYTYHEYTSDGNNKGVVIGNDVKNEPISLTVFAKRAYFKYQATEETPMFLVPSQATFETITEALTTMTTRPDQYSENKIDPSIPETIQIENVQTGGEGSSTVRIVLSPSSVLTNTDETIFALQAMLMTAKEFGFQQVIFETDQNGMIGNIQLNEPIDVPYSPNPIPYPF